MDSGGQNRLEPLLALAVEGPTHRPEFYRLMLESKVYIIGRTAQGQDYLKAVDSLSKNLHLGLGYFSVCRSAACLH